MSNLGKATKGCWTSVRDTTPDNLIPISQDQEHPLCSSYAGELLQGSIMCLCRLESTAGGRDTGDHTNSTHGRGGYAQEFFTVSLK